MQSRTGRNPVRRNRNIGTAAQGHGLQNRFTIPDTANDGRVYWQRLADYVVVHREVHGRQLPFVVERTRRDNFHARTVDDVATVMRHLSPSLLFGFDEDISIKGIVFRQPTRKQQSLTSVWGRLGYDVDVGPLRGGVILLEAQPAPLTAKWDRHLNPSEQSSFDRHMREASEAMQNRRGWTLQFDLTAIREVQLYWTLLHEIGHWVHYMGAIVLPQICSYDDAEDQWNRYWNGPSREREYKADAYAGSFAQALRQQGIIPFDRIISNEQLAADGLCRSDFLPDSV